MVNEERKTSDQSKIPNGFDKFCTHIEPKLVFSIPRFFKNFKIF